MPRATKPSSFRPAATLIAVLVGIFAVAGDARIMALSGGQFPIKGPALNAPTGLAPWNPPKGARDREQADGIGSAAVQLDDDPAPDILYATWRGIDMYPEWLVADFMDEIGSEQGVLMASGLNAGYLPVVRKELGIQLAVGLNGGRPRVVDQADGGDGWSALRIRRGAGSSWNFEPESRGEQGVTGAGFYRLLGEGGPDVPDHWVAIRGVAVAAGQINRDDAGRPDAVVIWSPIVSRPDIEQLIGTGQTDLIQAGVDAMANPDEAPDTLFYAILWDLDTTGRPREYTETRSVFLGRDALGDVSGDVPYGLGATLLAAAAEDTAARIAVGWGHEPSESDEEDLAGAVHYAIGSITETGTLEFRSGDRDGATRKAVPDWNSRTAGVGMDAQNLDSDPRPDLVVSLDDDYRIAWNIEPDGSPQRWGEWRSCGRDWLTDPDSGTTTVAMRGGRTEVRGAAVVAVRLDDQYPHDILCTPLRSGERSDTELSGTIRMVIADVPASSLDSTIPQFDWRTAAGFQDTGGVREVQFNLSRNAEEEAFQGGLGRLATSGAPGVPQTTASLTARSTKSTGAGPDLPGMPLDIAPAATPTVVQHSGTPIVLFRGNNAQIYYSPLGLTGQFLPFRQLPLPQDADDPSVTSLTSWNETTGIRDRYSTAHLTAEGPIRAISDGSRLVVFRNSTEGRLLVDAYLFNVLTGELVRAPEARFKVSRQRYQRTTLVCRQLGGASSAPDADAAEEQCDALGYRSTGGQLFQQPTLELGLVGDTSAGFDVALVPSNAPTTRRWVIARLDDTTGRVHVTTIRQDPDTGLFERCPVYDAPLVGEPRVIRHNLEDPGCVETFTTAPTSSQQEDSPVRQQDPPVRQFSFALADLAQPDVVSEGLTGRSSTSFGNGLSLVRFYDSTIDTIQDDARTERVLQTWSRLMLVVGTARTSADPSFEFVRIVLPVGIDGNPLAPGQTLQSSDLDGNPVTRRVEAGFLDPTLPVQTVPTLLASADGYVHLLFQGGHGGWNEVVYDTLTARRQSTGRAYITDGVHPESVLEEVRGGGGGSWTGPIRTVFGALGQRIDPGFAPVAVEFGMLNPNPSAEVQGWLARAGLWVLNGKIYSRYLDDPLGELDVFRIGDYDSESVLIGYVEGAPPVPASHLPVSPDDPVDIHNGVAEVTFNQALAFSKEKSNNLTDGVNLEIEASVGTEWEISQQAGTAFFSTGWTTAEGMFKAKATQSFEWSRIDDNSTTAGASREIAFPMVHTGSACRGVANTQGAAGDVTAPEMLPTANDCGSLGRDSQWNIHPYGAAIVKKESFTLFGLRLQDSDQVYGYALEPTGPTITGVPFRLNPAYLTPGDLNSYAKRDRFKLRRNVELSNAMKAGGLQAVSSVFDQLGDDNRYLNIAERLDSAALGSHYNTYYWDHMTTAGASAASGQNSYSLVTSETTGSALNFLGMGGLASKFSVLGLLVEGSVMIGGHKQTANLTTESAENAFQVNASVDGLSAHITVAGDVNGRCRPEYYKHYAWDTYYLQPSGDNWDEFWNEVVDPTWLAAQGSNHALRLAQSAQIPVWRVLHRTYDIHPCHGADPQATELGQ